MKYDQFSQDISALFPQTREIIKMLPCFDLHLLFDRSTNPLFVVTAQCFVCNSSLYGHNKPC